MAADLRPDLLYLVVFGPGEGEALALRVPPATWILVDGCEIGGSSPTAELLRQAGAVWSCVILTHPHLDHVRGLDRVLEMVGEGPVGCSDLRVEDPELWVDSPDAVTHAQRGAVEHVLSAIATRWQAEPGSRWLMRRGDVKQVGDAHLAVLHPDEAIAEAIDPARFPNRLSSPMLVTWNEVKLVLGADVENDDWPAISASSPDLALHAAMKIPHHGSLSSYRAGGWPGDRTRLWVVTPFPHGKHLPGFADGDGASCWLTDVDALHLTSLAGLHDLEGQVPFRTTRTELRDGLRPRRIERQLRRKLLLRQPSVPSSGSSFIAAGFDACGDLLDLRYGPGSVVVTEEA